MGGGSKKSSSNSAGASSSHDTASGSGSSPTFRVVMLNAPPMLKHKEVSMPLKELNMTSGLQRNLREGLSWAPVCTWYTLGNCRNGDNCNYIHPKWHLVEKYEWKGVAPHCNPDALERIVEANSKLLTAGGGQQAQHTTSAALLDAVEALGRQPTTAGDQLLCVMHVLRYERKNLTPLRSEVSNAWLRHFDTTDKAVRNRSIEEAVKNNLLVATGGHGADARLCLPDVAKSLGVLSSTESEKAAETAPGSKSQQQQRNETTGAAAATKPGSQASTTSKTKPDAKPETQSRSATEETQAAAPAKNAAAKAAAAAPTGSKPSAWKTNVTAAAVETKSAASEGASTAAIAPAAAQTEAAATAGNADGPRWAGLFTAGGSSSKAAARAALQQAPALETALPTTPDRTKDAKPNAAGKSSTSTAQQPPAAAAAPVPQHEQQPAAQTQQADAAPSKKLSKTAAVAPIVAPLAPAVVPVAEETPEATSPPFSIPADIAGVALSSTSPNLPPTVSWDAADRGLTFNTSALPDDALDPTNPWLTFRITPESALATPQESPPRPGHHTTLRNQLAAIYAADISANPNRFEYAEPCAATFACSLCSRYPTQPVETDCSHLICKACLERQLTEQLNATCPRCYKEIERVTNPPPLLLDYFKQLQVICKQCTWRGQRAAYDQHTCRELSAKTVAANAEALLASGDIKGALLACRAFAGRLEDATSREGIIRDQREYFVKILCLESNCLCKLERYEDAATRAREAIGINDNSIDAQYRLGMALGNIASSWSMALAAFEKCLVLDPSRMDIMAEVRALQARIQLNAVNASVRASAKEFRPPPPYVLPTDRPHQMHTRHLDPDTNNHYWADHAQKRTFWYSPDAQTSGSSSNSFSGPSVSLPPPPPRRSPQESPMMHPAAVRVAAAGGAGWGRPPPVSPPQHASVAGARLSPPQYPSAYGSNVPPPPPPAPSYLHSNGGGSDSNPGGYANPGRGGYGGGNVPQHPHMHHHHHHQQQHHHHGMHHPHAHLHHHHHHMMSAYHHANGGGGGNSSGWDPRQRGPPPPSMASVFLNAPSQQAPSSGNGLGGPRTGPLGTSSSNGSAPQYRFTSKAVNVTESPY